MKSFQPWLVMGLLAVSAGATANESWSLNEFKPHVLPVLVQVDSKGKVTDVSPSSELTPGIDRLLRSSLSEMISKPAMRKGKPMASQFVINLALKVTPLDSGDYDAQFTYVSAKPVPSGSWYWSHEDGHRLALVNRGSFWNWRNSHMNDARSDFGRSTQGNFGTPASSGSATAASPSSSTHSSGK